jgi:polyhydroxybutyrate depolymerase
MSKGLKGWLLIVVMLFSLTCPVLAEDPVLTGTLLQDTLVHDGIKRSFLVYMPDGDIAGRPVILVLHGSKGKGKSVRQQSVYQFDALADREKFIVVYPDGYKKHWNGCRSAPKDKAHKKDIDDVGFLTALIGMCSTRWGTDPARVYAVGFSNGGHMCFRLAAQVPDKIAGITAIAANMPAPGWSKCPAPGRAFPVMIVNGTDDPINPYDGGMVRLFHFIKKGEVLPALDSARAWLKPDDADNNPVIEQREDHDAEDETTVEVLTWPGSRVRLYTVRGGGHTIPGGEQYLPASVVGRVSHDINIAREVWGFFVGGG